MNSRITLFLKCALLTLFLGALSCNQFPDSPSGNGGTRIVWTKPRESIWGLTDRIQPVIENGRVYAAFDSTLVCCELESGDEFW